MKKPLTPVLGQVSDYEIRLLKVFKTVVECGGFSAAETELSIGRSTISIHISSLEERMGLRLCSRGRGGFSLTDEGQLVYSAMQQLFSSLEQFRSQVNTLHTRLTGELRIVVTDTVSLDPRAGLQQAIGRFSELAPEVHLALDVAPMTEIERQVLRGEADIGLIPYHRKLEGLNYHPIYQDLCHLYCADSHPLFALSDRAGDSAEEREETRNELRQLLPEQKIVHAGIHTNSEVVGQLSGLNRFASAYFYEARLTMILSGHYLGFMPDEFVRPWVESGQLRAVLPEEKYYRLAVAAITSPGKTRARARDLFMAVVEDIHGGDV